MDLKTKKQWKIYCKKWKNQIYLYCFAEKYTGTELSKAKSFMRNEIMEGAAVMNQIKHGFTNREEWGSFFTHYNKLVNELNDAGYNLIENKLDYKEWIQEFEKKSQQTKISYGLVEEMLKQHIYYFTEDGSRWTMEVALPLLEYLFRYATWIEDVGNCYEIAVSLQRYFGNPKNEIALMKCYTIKACCLILLDRINMADKIWENCELARKYYERNFIVLNPEEQSMGLTIYDLGFDILEIKVKSRTSSKRELIDQFLTYCAAAETAKRYVISVDKGYEFNRIMPDYLSRIALLAVHFSKETCSRRQAAAIYRAALKVKCMNEAQQDNSYAQKVHSQLLHQMAARLMGYTKKEDILNYLDKILEEIPLGPEDKGFDLEKSNLVDAIYLSAENLFTEEEKKTSLLYRKILSWYQQYFFLLPLSAWGNYTSGYHIYSFICNSLRYFPEEGKLSILLQLTIYRQVQTAIHSVMVGKISRAILKTAVEVRPELLVGFPDLPEIKDVQEKKEELLDFIYKCALVHDIGKLLCSNTINCQYRKLCDIEFEGIKYHPLTGGKMLEDSSELAKFRQIALGHHKSYNGKAGYPEDFDMGAASVKLLIDLIAISDGLDAATDNMGRSYAVTKKFETVLGEFIKGKGERYSPEWVELIESNKELCQELKSLLKEGRSETYYEVYKLIGKNKSDCADESVWQLPLQLQL